MFVSTNDMGTVKESMDSLFAIQNKSTGQLPYAGDPFQLLIGPIYSPTYHMYNLIDIYDYYQYTQDLEYLQGKWEQWKFGLNFSLSFIDETGLFNATGSADWLRFGMGGHNIEANAILYYTLSTAMKLGAVLNDTVDMPRWRNASDYIKRGANELLWNATAGMYRDNETTSLMPQDGNSWAVIANLTESLEQSAQISSGLRSRWTAYGAPAPEASTAISPYVGGYEIQMHTLAGNVSASLDLIRLQWGFMLDDPRMTNSTFIEGYRNDGELKYAPYSNDPRISHSHGWATGPTSYLTFYVAGLQIVTAAGQTWRVAPQLGDLQRVDAGYQTPLGDFAAQTNATGNGGLSTDFSTPDGTEGSVAIPYPSCDGLLTLTRQVEHEACVTVEVKGQSQAKGNLEVAGIDGGLYRMVFECQS
ncbi:Six-hairpin glycosidase-like protein [Elsinoe ampelina]|uniref:Six-hairpin glycosidase-like protein n=1 Tax=Elsinoe ampelina TaxID=302913 RepID=A0A6A6GMC0_9PEZI|nr:Six-hairpin glycosidase-like protein [Elsinoe ampelina]